MRAEEKNGPDPQAVYFAPSKNPATTWILILPESEAKRMQPKLRGLGTRQTHGEMARWPTWNVAARNVATVAQLLAREGLRVPGDDLLVDEVLSTITPLELGALNLYDQPIFIQVIRLMALPDEHYRELYEVALQRLRPDVIEAASKLSDEQLRRLFAEVADLNQQLLPRGLTLRSSGIELDAVLREVAPDGAYIDEMVANLGQRTPLAQMLSEMGLDSLRSMARDLFPRVRKLPREVLIPMIELSYEKLSPERRAHWEGVVAAERAEKEQAAKAKEVERKEEAIREAQRKAKLKVLYDKNADLYPYLPDLPDQIVTIRRGENGYYRDSLINLDPEQVPAVGQGRIVRVKDRWVAHKRGEEIDYNDRLSSGQWGFIVQPIEPIPRGRGGRTSLNEVVFITYDSKRMHPGLVFAHGRYVVDLAPALQRLVARDIRVEAARLHAILPGQLVRYIQAAISKA